MSNSYSRTLVILLSSIFLSLVHADECGIDRGCWGAVGTGEGEIWAWAVDYWNEQAALDAMQAECSDKCDNWLTFYEACGVIAEDPERNWGWAYAPNFEYAQSLALEACLDDGGTDCKVLVWSCSQ